MNKLSVFKNKKIVLPVIHVQSFEQAKNNIEICQEHGADGCFLIGHEVSDADLIGISYELSSDVEDFWMGINCLASSPAEAIRDASFMDGVWTDNAFDSQIETVYNGIYFGGVAFKYQRNVMPLHEACAQSKNFVDVVTTSGPSTGNPPDLSKIQTMRECLGDHPLAIASGITAENVSQFLPYVDCFLVATGISRNWQEFDPAKLKELVSKVRVQIL